MLSGLGMPWPWPGRRAGWLSGLHHGSLSWPPAQCLPPCLSHQPALPCKAESCSTQDFTLIRHSLYCQAVGPRAVDSLSKTMLVAVTATPLPRGGGGKRGCAMARGLQQLPCKAACVQSLINPSWACPAIHNNRCFMYLSSSNKSLDLQPG